MFENITAAPADPILGLADSFVPMTALKKLTSELVFTRMKPVKHHSDQRQKSRAVSAGK